jgi:hypothetical protein
VSFAFSRMSNNVSMFTFCRRTFTKEGYWDLADYFDGVYTKAAERVHNEFVPLDHPWPKIRVPITLKNLGDSIVQYRYPEDGVIRDGFLTEDQISEKPTMFYLNTEYKFTLLQGSNVISTS